MPIEKGKDWGSPAPVPEGAVEVVSDAQARAVLERAIQQGQPLPVLVLRGGDLCRTLGGGEGRAVTGVSFPIDIGEVRVNGQRYLFVAHLVARSRFWSRAFVAMNAQWLGPWNLGPRAHPGDGLLDTYDISLPLSQRLAVRSRLGHGAHLPHPGIRDRRTAAVEVELERAQK
ncbi:MAG: hypothetical protein ACRDRT_13695, partial [Pseudonocardiaceae bacterium]